MGSSVLRLFIVAFVFVAFAVGGIAEPAAVVQALSDLPQASGSTDAGLLEVPHDLSELPSAVGFLLGAAREWDGYVSLASVGAAFGGSVQQGALKGQYLLNLPTGTLELQQDSQVASYQGVERGLGSPFSLRDGKPCLKVTDVAELLDYEVYSEEQEVILLAEQGAEQAVGLVEGRTFMEGPAWYLVGRVRNSGEWARELTRVSWEVGTSDGTITARTAGYINSINPTLVKPFKLILPLRGDASWYRVRVAPGFLSRPREITLVAANPSPYGDRPAHYLSLLGEVTNVGEARCDFTKVMVEFYDDMGRLLDVDGAFLSSLESGETRAYTAYTTRVKQACTWQVTFD